jgi:hypothetical protein
MKMAVFGMLHHAVWQKLYETMWYNILEDSHLHTCHDFDTAYINSKCVNSELYVEGSAKYQFIKNG